ncbi:SurA N-terminal domain-containing protein [Salidesulfovibrio brasiliensis]|uniref:SurA N-terminal domain-containing protein n=1 Tax=Salidesulfovibrio brasiliensis TaxID=221711 RepID=UPI0006D118C9|nr:peptidyl-prolyl cis-trans isomerase [Salidesulfovibrio brasiliensis]
MKRFLTVVALLALVASTFAGCAREDSEVGVVARVNGEPIMLDTLEYIHDMQSLANEGDGIPSVEVLRSEYRDILSGLIVSELVRQELVNLGLEVTEEELRQQEETIRADYPEGEFEMMLREQYVDLDHWRIQMKDQLATRKFMQQVLRPKIKIDYKEAEQYYKAHIADFVMPASMRLLVIRGPNQQIVEGAVAKFRDEKDIQGLSEAFTELEVRELVMNEKRLPAIWKASLRGLKVGQSSGVIKEKFGYEALVVLERTPEKVLSPTQVYPLVEEVLLERKMEQAFDEWLDQAVSGARIEISEHLLESAPEDAQDNATTD